MAGDRRRGPAAGHEDPAGRLLHRREAHPYVRERLLRFREAPLVRCGELLGARRDDGVAYLVRTFVPGRPLGDLAGKYTVASLAAFLQDPLKVRPSGRMPGLNLTGTEASDLANFLPYLMRVWLYS